MLSLRSWNENSSTLGLVVDGRGRGRRRKFDMEKNEPEKHESYSGQEDDVNPDFLSYIDERIEDVLGHFQKEFQGGVPVENLGAQYGGYGSFLPSYQRCPSILSQPRSPEKISNHVSRSPYKLQPKDRHHKPSVPGTSPSSRASIESKEKPLEMSDKRKASINTQRAVGISHSLSKSVDIDDQKIPELCIKVGHDNGLTRNKPDIYSDLGLDFSPSPSLKDTPDGGEECSLESPDAFRESPTTILQIMTCLSVPEGYLSPLPDSLLHSTGKDDIFLKKNKAVFHHKGRTEAHVASSDNSLNGKFIRSYTCEKSKSKDKSQMLWESVKFLGTCDEVAILKKEPEAKTPVAHSAQGVITNALSREKRQTISDSEKEIFKDPDNESLKESAPLSDVKKDNLVGFVESTSNGVAGNSVINNIHYNASVNFKSSFIVKTPEERFGSKQETSYAKAEMGSKNLKNYDTTKAKSSRYIGRKNHTTKPKEPVNTTYVMTVSSSEKDVLSRIQEIDPAYGGSTLKENTSNDKSLAEPLKENLTTISAAASNLKKGMLKASKLHKEDSNNKAIKYHTGFGISTCIQEADGNKHGSSRFIEKSKEKLQLNKVANLQIANSVTDALVFDPLTKNSQTSDATATVSPPVIEENWVCCDICQTWRLLPYGTNPDNLPTEWQCSMQVWMPGLNKCYISQDETTKAFHQLYQVPAPVNAINLSIHPDNSLSSIKSSGILDHNGRLENNVCSAPLGGKEKRVLMNASNLPRDSSLSHSNSGKNIQPSLGNKRLKHEGSLTQHRIRQMSTSGGHTIEKYDHKVEMPFKILASCPNEGDLFENYSKQSMSKCKRQVDKDDQRSSKKVKKDRLSHYEKDLHTEDSRVARKVLQSSGNQSHSSSVEHRKHVRASDAKHPDKYDFKDKKRELKELQESGTHHKNSMTSQRIANDRPMIKFGSSESELRRLKKAKVEKFEGQDSSAVIFDGEVDKNGCQTRNKLYNIENYQPHKGDEGSIHALECVGAMKRDVTNVQPVAAATSSSSKVSGSQKRKVKLQEVRGSPVESVSSSPMRILNTKKNSRNLLTNNDDILNTSTLKGSSKCSSDGDVGGNSDQSGTVTKDPASISRLRVTKASKTAEPGVLDSFYTSNEYQGRKAKRLSVRKTGNGLYNHDDILSSDYGHANSVYDDENIINQLDRHPLMQSNTNHNCKQYERHDSGYQMPVKSSSFCRDSNKDCTFDSKKFKIKILNSYSDLKELDHLHLNKEDNLESYCKQHKVPDSRIIVAGARHAKLISQENLHQPSAHQRQDHSSQIVVERLEEKNGWGSQMALTSNNKRISRHYHVDSVNSRASKSAKQLRKSHDLNGTRPQPTASATKCSPLKKDGLTTVNAYIQEARELKHIADHLKNEGLGHESSGIYFEASLKFLHVASLMESTNSETAKQGELFPSQQMLQMYLETALLCEFCAREYENLKEMAAAALAYKCAEVAYMKVAYFKHPSASKDQHDLQAALDATLPDEPTSSSASDVDSLINQGDSEKAVSVRANGSPQIAGNNVIAAQNRPHVKRLLTFTNYINCAFEAANKSQNAIAIASIDLKNDRVESLCSVRKVLDFNFYNVEGLLQLIRISLNSISSKV